MANKRIKKKQAKRKLEQQQMAIDCLIKAMPELQKACRNVIRGLGNALKSFGEGLIEAIESE